MSGRLTNGAPRNAMSNGTCFSLVRHCTQGSFAKVVIPENTASAVTGRKVNPRARTNHRRDSRDGHTTTRENRLTRVVARVVCRLIRVADIVERHLVFVMTNAERSEGQQERSKQGKFSIHPFRKIDPGNELCNARGVPIERPLLCAFTNF